MIKLKQTCGACPEQYDAFDGDKQVGYLRLRHCSFYVQCPDCGDGPIVYEAYPRGNGCFEIDERDYYLRFAVAAIEAWMRGEETRPKAPDVQYEII